MKRERRLPEGSVVGIALVAGAAFYGTLLALILWRMFS